ncbi:hypothetical protein [Nocardia sp. NPDC020380]|uniref:hypothetical protein n=1 Tax=Nocardia sp. NPDC020380 TaxID=3364309 RepID=UPI0037BA5CAF
MTGLLIATAQPAAADLPDTPPEIALPYPAQTCTKDMEGQRFSAEGHPYTCEEIDSEVGPVMTWRHEFDPQDPRDIAWQQWYRDHGYATTRKVDAQPL